MGAPAEDVELLVTKPIEEKIRGLDGVYRILSTSSSGSANISVEINGNIKRPLFIFANPLETKPPRRGDPGVIYYGPGNTEQAFHAADIPTNCKVETAPGVNCALEHGGAAPVIVEPDADIDAILPGLVKGGYYHAGQVCVSVQRMFIHKKILLVWWRQNNDTDQQFHW